LRLYVDNPVVNINGISRAAQAAPFVDPASGQPMIPLRMVAETLGVQTNWRPGSQAVVLVRGNTSFTLPIGEPLPNNMGTAMIVDGRTFVPLAFVSQALGANVLWDEVNGVVHILAI